MAFPSKGTPQIEVIVFPRSAIPQRKINSYVIADTLADLLLPDKGAAGIRATTTTVHDFANLSNGLQLFNVGYAHFHPDSTVSHDPNATQAGKGGFYVQPQEVPHNSYVSGGSGNVEWQAVKGTFRTVPALDPQNGGGGSAIYNASSTDDTFIAQTTLERPKNQAIRSKMKFTGLNRSGSVPSATQEIGKDMRISYTHGLAPTLERKYYDAHSNPAWSVVVAHSKVGPVNMRGGEYVSTVRHLDGRLVWDCNGHSVWLYDTTQGRTPPPAGTFNTKVAKPKQWDWEAAPLRVTLTNVRARIETSHLDYNAAGSGTVTRRVMRPLNMAQIEAGGSSYSGGWQRSGTGMPVTVTPGTGYVDYSVQLTPSPDGVHTPFLSHVLNSHSPVWVSPIVSGIDITKAVSAITITLAAPPTQAGSQGTMEISGKALGTISGAYTNCQDYCLVHIRARWNASDGTPGPWCKLFRGYIYGQTRSSNAVGDQTITLTLRDQIVRLSDDNARIDGKFRPLGMILMDKMAVVEGNNGFGNEGNPLYTPENPRKIALYGGECVKEIIRVQLGDAEANSLNGDGNARRFFPSGYPPLWDSSGVMGSYLALAAGFNVNLESGSLEDGIPFAPPFGDACLDWINKFGNDEAADFFTGVVDRDADDWPSLIYGQYIYYLDNAKPWNLTDRLTTTHHIPVEGDPFDTPNLQDLDYLVSQASSETRPQSDINCIQVLATLPGAENPFRPALTVGESHLPGSNPNSEVYSWQRTKIYKNNLLVEGPDAQIVADDILAGIAGTKKQWPPVTIRGEGKLLVGDMFRCNMSGPNSFTQMGIDGLLFRITTATHRINMNDKMPDWQTDITGRPMSALEDARARRIHFSA